MLNSYNAHPFHSPLIGRGLSSRRLNFPSITFPAAQQSYRLDVEQYRLGATMSSFRYANARYPRTYLRCCTAGAMISVNLFSDLPSPNLRAAHSKKRPLYRSIIMSCIVGAKGIRRYPDLMSNNNILSFLLRNRAKAENISINTLPFSKCLNCSARLLTNSALLHRYYSPARREKAELLKYTFEVLGTLLSALCS